MRPLFGALCIATKCLWPAAKKLLRPVATDFFEPAATANPSYVWGKADAVDLRAVLCLARLSEGHGHIQGTGWSRAVHSGAGAAKAA